MATTLTWTQEFRTHVLWGAGVVKHEPWRVRIGPTKYCKQIIIIIVVITNISNDYLLPQVWLTSNTIKIMDIKNAKMMTELTLKQFTLPTACSWNYWQNNKLVYLRKMCRAVTILQLKPTDMGWESDCRMPSSTLTIAIYCTESWRIFYHPIRVEG